MYTQCPQCLTYFQVTPEHLRIAQGNVRCGQCRNVFSALGNLTEEPPKTAYQEDENVDLEEEIFIDEAELQGYGEEFLEEYEEEIVNDEYADADEFSQEYDEEYYIVEDELEERDQEPEPQDLDKTQINPPPGSAQHSTRHNLRPQVPTANINSKLNEAIATIERLKQSYTNLSIRKMEPNNGITNHNPTAAELKAEPQTPEKHTAKPAAAAPSAPSTGVDEPPSSAAIFSPFIDGPKEPPKTAPSKTAPPQKSPPNSHSSRPSDIAIESYTDDDGVDYEEALNALNDLKILEEEEAIGEEEMAESEFSEGVILPQQPTSAIFPNPPPTMGHESAAQPPASREQVNPFTNQDLRKPETPPPAAEPDVRDSRLSAPPKKKPLARKSGDKKRAKPKKSVTPRSTDSASAPMTENAVTNLPAAIPKQLLEDFHPSHGFEPHSTWKNSLWAMGSLMLMVVFLIQTVYFKHNDLAQISPLRSWVETFCDYMSCTLSLPSDVKLLELVSQDIRSHPKVKNALLVTTTIINNARFAQAYPGLQITFTDLNGQRIAMRRFTPREYLAPDIIQDDGMPPNTPIQVELEMMDPGSNAVNFEFDFIPL